MSATQQTMVRLRELRLTTMAETYELQLQQPKVHQLAFDDRFGMLVKAEASARESRKLGRLVKAAALPETASLEEIDHRPFRGIDKSMLSALANCDWIRNQLNLIINGATGVGKTWLPQRTRGTAFRSCGEFSDAQEGQRR